MIPLALVLFCLSCLGILIFLGLFLLMRYRKKQRVMGVKLLQAQRMLVKHLQIHRGLMAAYLGGNQGLNDSISLHVQSIVDDIQNISMIDEEYSNNPNWHCITQHWARLSTTGRTLGVYQNYDQHCKLVASLLAIMQWTAINYGVLGRFGQNEKIYWYELLALGEKLGQLRALGVTCLVSRKERSLKDLCLRHIETCLGDIERIFTNQFLLLKLGEQKRDEINTFVALVEHDIILSNSWITGDQYFSRATETIEIIYGAFDEEMQKLLWLC